MLSRVSKGVYLLEEEPGVRGGGGVGDFSSRFGLKKCIDFKHFGLRAWKKGYGFYRNGYGF